VAVRPEVFDLAHRKVIANIRAGDDDAVVSDVGKQVFEVGTRIGEVLQDFRGDNDVERVGRQLGRVDEFGVVAQLHEVADRDPARVRKLGDVVVVNALSSAVDENAGVLTAEHLQAELGHPELAPGLFPRPHSRGRATAERLGGDSGQVVLGVAWQRHVAAGVAADGGHRAPVLGVGHDLLVQLGGSTHQALRLGRERGLRLGLDGARLPLNRARRRCWADLLRVGSTHGASKNVPGLCARLSRHRNPP
jgi:hypothetical protein